MNPSFLRFPGLIDCHVHFREPGLIGKGDMTSESAAAVAGGVMTVCEMPNTKPPTVTVEALRGKVERAKQSAACDMRFFFGITAAEHLDELRKLFTDASFKELAARCCGVKLYMDHSTGNQKIDALLLGDAFKVCAELRIVTVCHCEDPATNAEAAASMTDQSISAHSLRRPPEAEDIAIQRAIDLTRMYGTHLHIAHLSTMQGVELVRTAKKEGLPVTCEVAPHHLFLSVEDYEVLGTLGKMNPPLRTMEHVEALWAGIADETIDCIATDHAPHTLAEKQTAKSLDAPSGVPGVETMLPLLLTVAAGQWPHPSGRRIAGAQLSYDDIIRLCFTNPNKIFHLGASDEKKIEIDPAAAWTIRAAELQSKCGWTPFEGWRVKGRVVRL